MLSFYMCHKRLKMENLDTNRMTRPGEGISSAEMLGWLFLILNQGLVCRRSFPRGGEAGSTLV